MDYTTLYRWIQHYAPEMEKILRWHYKPTMGYGWWVDETYVKVKGTWAYCTGLLISATTRLISISFLLTISRQPKGF